MTSASYRYGLSSSSSSELQGWRQSFMKSTAVEVLTGPSWAPIFNTLYRWWSSRFIILYGKRNFRLNFDIGKNCVLFIAIKLPRWYFVASFLNLLYDFCCSNYTFSIWFLAVCLKLSRCSSYCWAYSCSITSLMGDTWGYFNSTPNINLKGVMLTERWKEPLNAICTRSTCLYHCSGWSILNLVNTLTITAFSHSICLLARGIPVVIRTSRISCSWQ